MSGLILAGGRSLRMQGCAPDPVDKGLLSLHGRPLIQHARRFMRSQGIDTVLISANRQLDRYAAYGRVVVDDPDAGEYQGPLQGIAAALEVLQTPWLFVMPVDVLGLPIDLAERLRAGARQSHLAFAATDAPHPLCLAMHASQRAALLEFLGQGRRKVRDWLSSSGARTVSFAPACGAFLNINTLEDLARASAQPVR